MLPDKINLTGNPTAGQYKTALGEFYDYVDGLHFWGAAKVIALGDIVFKPNSSSSVYAKCTVAGITGTAEPVWPTVGNTITDGTVTWEMYEITNAEKVGGNLPSNIYLKDSDQPSFRNKLINGNFVINQEVKSGAVTLAAGAYGHDGWKAGASGCTYTFAAVANVTTLTISAGSLMQIIEGINLQSGTYVVSWRGTAQGKVDGAYADSGFTFMATGGTNATVAFGTGTLSNVQVEKGSIATEFEDRPIPLEKFLCKQYWQSGEIFLPAITAASYVGGVHYFIVPFRVSPTFSYKDMAGNANKVTTNTQGNNIAVAYGSIGVNKDLIKTDVGFTLSPGNWINFTFIADARL